MNSPLTRELDKYEDGDFVAHYAEEHSLDKYRELASRLAAMDLWAMFASSSHRTHCHIIVIN